MMREHIFQTDLINRTLSMAGERGVIVIAAPPGTGKSTAILLLADNLARQNSDAHILLVSPGRALSTQYLEGLTSLRVKDEKPRYLCKEVSSSSYWEGTVPRSVCGDHHCDSGPVAASS